MLGAHLDSWHSGTGASDNADGAAVAMEALRILKAIGAQPKRTIRVAIWSGEEEGLLGSAKYVERYLKGDDKKAEREKLSVYLNIDPGTGPIYGFYMENNDAAKAIFDAWLEPLRDLGMRRNVLPGIGATDHLSFTRVGIPGFNVVRTIRITTCAASHKRRYIRACAGSRPATERDRAGFLSLSCGNP
jgi:Zn-dependent M28 family amino/carboxypeptidase